MCKIQAALFDKDSVTWQRKSITYGDCNITLRENSISHESVQMFVNNLDLSDIHTLPGYCGAFRTATPLCTMIVDLHMKCSLLRKKLRWFNDIENHFIMEFSDDGAPETKNLTMTIGSITCWNFGNRVRNRDFHYILHTVDASEEDAILWEQHADEMLLLEGNVIVFNTERVTKEFRPSEDQACQIFAKMNFQSATYPSLFAKVHKSKLTKIDGSIGNTPNCVWAIPTEESRKADLEKLNIKREDLKKLNPSEMNFHKKELEFMAQNGLRQLGPPRIGVIANHQERSFTDTLHLEVNNWAHVLDVVYLYAIRTVFIKVLSNKIEAGGCGLKFICKRIKEFMLHPINTINYQGEL